MNRLNVLFITSWYPHEENIYQGIFVKEHAKAAALYNNVSVLFAYKSDNLKKLYEVNETIEEGIETYRIKYRTSLPPKANIILYTILLLMFFNKLLKKGNRFDLIHAHVFYAGVPAAIISKIYKIPFVISEHYSGIPLGKLSTTERILFRFAMKNASFILPVTYNLREHIKRYGINNRFYVLPNAIDTGTFYPQKKPIRSDKKLLLVASLIPIKGIPYLLEALKQIDRKRNNFTLDIIGEGTCRATYEKMVFDFGINDVVKFHGAKSKTEVAEYMRQSDFIVLPSIWESQPCVLLEAIASGIPVITTDVGGVKEIINRDMGIIVPPEDTSPLKEAIENMLDDFGSYSVEKIVQYAKKRFSYEAVGKEIDDIYKEVAGKLL